MNCECCQNELGFEPNPDDKPVRQAVKAQAAGVWVKNWTLFGDTTGYHYFCSRLCGDAWRDAHVDFSGGTTASTTEGAT